MPIPTRSESQMLTLILNTAHADERIRAVIMNGSRANPAAPKDCFQDFDIVYVVTDPAPFRAEPGWIDRFGELMIKQEPDGMGVAPAGPHDRYAYLMQFADGNRIDLTLFPLDQLSALPRDSQSILLLDKDGLIEPFPPPSDADYLPSPPTAQEFQAVCNEFWWVSTYVAKGLWRRELPYALQLFDDPVRAMLYRMLVWSIGIATDFAVSPGKLGKYFERLLPPAIWQAYLKTYSDADLEHVWEALFTMTNLFREVAQPVADHYAFSYPSGDDARVTAFLRHVRTLPPDAARIYEEES